MSNAITSLCPQMPADMPQPGNVNHKLAGGFGDALASAIDQVDDLQTNADLQVAGLLEGTGQDVHSAMVAVEKADIGFQLMIQVRNKIVNAYQEMSRMQF